jgi:hypothetical protein
MGKDRSGWHSTSGAGMSDIAQVIQYGAIAGMMALCALMALAGILKKGGDK